MTRPAAGRLGTEGDGNASDRRRAWQHSHLGHETTELLERDARHFLHQSLSTPCLNVLRSCRGSRLEDLEGRTYLDFHGNSVHQVGFGHPRVIAAVKRQLDELPFCTRRYTNRPAVELAERLASLAPGRLNKVLFAPAGALAVSMALKLARVATGRHKTVSFWGSFHGATLDTISVGGEASFRAGMGPLLAGTEHVAPPDPYRCAYGCRGACELRCADYLEHVLEQEGDVAAVVAEPVRCTTVTPPPPGYWGRVREACDRHGALLVFDETALCLGRTGSLFAFEPYGAEPDLLVLGKGLGGGVFPLAALIAREELDAAGRFSLGHFTHEKSPVGCAAALATLDCLKEEDLVARSRRLGERFVARLRALATRHPLVGDVRGLGLLVGVELVTAGDGRAPAAGAAEEVLYEALSRGLSFKVSGGNVLTLTPPLTVSEEELDQAVSILDEALGLVERGNERSKTT